MMCPTASREYVSHMFTRLLEKERADSRNHPALNGHDPTAIADCVAYIKINDKDNITPVSDAKTIVQIIWLLPARAAREFRRKSAETICRVLGGDVSICQEIETRCARLQETDEGRAYQSFVTRQPPVKKQEVVVPFWFEYISIEEKREYASIEAKKNMVVSELGILKSCKDGLELVQRFDERDEIEFADRVKDVQRRAMKPVSATTAATDDTAICVAMPIVDTIDPVTGLLLATPKCCESIRGSETSIPNEAAKLGIRVGEKAGRVGKEIKRRYSERYGIQAGRDILKRSTTFRGKPFQENTYFSRDSDLIQQAIRNVCTPTQAP